LSDNHVNTLLVHSLDKTQLLRNRAKFSWQETKDC
jgi:hypothetical protein